MWQIVFKNELSEIKNEEADNIRTDHRWRHVIPKPREQLGHRNSIRCYIVPYTNFTLTAIPKFTIPPSRIYQQMD